VALVRDVATAEPGARPPVIGVGYGADHALVPRPRHPDSAVRAERQPDGARHRRTRRIAEIAAVARHRAMRARVRGSPSARAH
jgi:hypothetical protein